MLGIAGQNAVAIVIVYYVVLASELVLGVVLAVIAVFRYRDGPTLHAVTFSLRPEIRYVRKR